MTAAASREPERFGTIGTLDVTSVATACLNLCRHCYASASRKLAHPLDLDGIKGVMEQLAPVIRSQHAQPAAPVRPPEGPAEIDPGARSCDRSQWVRHVLYGDSVRAGCRPDPMYDGQNRSLFCSPTSFVELLLGGHRVHKRWLLLPQASCA